MFEEYSLFPLRPVDILPQDIDLGSLAIWDGVEAVEKCPDWRVRSSPATPMKKDQHVLSFAVLAFAVDDTNERERVMTSARPFAFLQPECQQAGTSHRSQCVLLVPVDLAELHERTLLTAELRLPLLHGRMFVNW